MKALRTFIDIMLAFDNAGMVSTGPDNFPTPAGSVAVSRPCSTCPTNPSKSTY